MPANAREVQRVAAKLGFVMERSRGSHAFWKHPDGRKVSIPAHGNRDLATGLFHAILKQLGISEVEFRALK